MSVSQEIKLEREKRKTAREERNREREKDIFALLSQPGVLNPLMGVGGAVLLQKLGQSRIIDRDFAGFLLAAWTAYCAANAGIRDKWALAAITAAATAAYSVTVPANEKEAILELHPSKLLGGDGKLFWWDLPLLGEGS